jgi:hypothetical protein
MLGAGHTRTDPVHLGLHNPATHRLTTQPSSSRDHLASSAGVAYSERCSAIIRITRSRTPDRSSSACAHPPGLRTMRHQTWVASRDSDGQKHPESSTGNFGVSTGNLGASTGNPYFHPLFNPSSIPNELNCFTADAARSNGNTKKTFTGWRPEERPLPRTDGS